MSGPRLYSITLGRNSRPILQDCRQYVRLVNRAAGDRSFEFRPNVIDITAVQTFLVKCRLSWIGFHGYPQFFVCRIPHSRTPGCKCPGLSALIQTGDGSHRCPTRKFPRRTKVGKILRSVLWRVPLKSCAFPWTASSKRLASRPFQCARRNVQSFVRSLALPQAERYPR